MLIMRRNEEHSPFCHRYFHRCWWYLKPNSPDYFLFAHPLDMYYNMATSKGVRPMLDVGAGLWAG